MKLLVFTSREELRWESCRSISLGLKAAYQSFEGADIHWIELSPSDFYERKPGIKAEIRRVAAAIKRIRPDRLVFLDQLPLPPVVLRNLLYHLTFDEIPPVFFHMYGDFTYFSGEWLSLLNQAASLKLHFIAASESQMRLLRHLLGPSLSTSVCHFPPSSDMSFDENLRRKMRQEQGVTESERILLYTGRISLQKNVDVLIKTFAEHCRRETHSQWRLWIAGGVDDLGAPFMGVSTPDGYMNSKLQKTLSEIPEAVRSRIKFWQFVDKRGIRELLSASDMFASLSLYHDEDFGMSPAEALLSGLPCVLTDWGGYSSFVSMAGEWDCQLVPVRIVDCGHSLDLKRFYQSLQNPLVISMSERGVRGEAFRRQFSAKAAAQILKDQLNLELPWFGDLGWRLPMFSKIADFYRRELNLDFVPSPNGFYGEVYSNYISLNRDQRDQ